VLKNTLKWSVFDDSDSCKVFSISGKNCSIAFSLEPGIHRVQRVPPTEKRGRRQTSSIAVAVLDVPKNIDFVLNENDLNIERIFGQGPGGQHKNKNATAIKITHIPTGVTAYSDGRSQYRNIQLAKSMIYARISEQKTEKARANYNSKRKKQIKDMGRGSRVRTYNFIEHRVKDERTGKNYPVKKIMKGELDLIYGEVL
jgi:peptide chain release factor 1